MIVKKVKMETECENTFFKTKVHNFRYNLVDLSSGYLQYLLLHSEEVTETARKKDNFSVIQYINIETLKSFIEINTEIYNALALLPGNNTYLNLGMGPGFLERIVALSGKLNLESVEWEEQDILFKPLREHLDVNVDYICNSVFDKDFQIYKCNKTYDYIIAFRFFPLNKHFSDLDQVKDILVKLQKYGKKLILIDPHFKYEEDVKEFFNSIDTAEILPKSENLDYWILDLSKI